MTKDPAFLFYSQDFLVGTLAMPFDEKGKYITILCYMHQNGRISEETIRLLVGSVSDMLRFKFKVDNEGKWYNERLEIEVEKRDKFKESRILNGKKGGRPPKIIAENIKKTIRLSVGKPKNNLIENENVIENIIKYLNEKTLSKYQSTNKDTVKLINGLIKSGFTEDDFKKVIDVKTDEWLNDPEMNQYLRPSTLFGTKFDNYYNQKPKHKYSPQDTFLEQL